MNDGQEGDDPAKERLRTSPTSVKSVPIHKRTLSGNLFSRLNFLRSTSSEDRISHSASSAIESDQPSPDGVDNAPKSAMAAVQGSLRGRQRKTSLRKTALLGGTGRRKSLPLQRKGSSKTPQQQKQQQQQQQQQQEPPQQESIIQQSEVISTKSNDQEQPELRQSFSYESLDAASSASAWSPRPSDGLMLDTQRHLTRHGSSEEAPIVPAPVVSTSPSVTSPASQSYASTTDDDDVLSFSRRPATGPLHQPVSSMSYYASQQPIVRRRSNKQVAGSPHEALPLDTYISSTPIEEELDYSDTEWWGWVVLIVTWFAFVVGMGSCFGVWSWAWDVGQTPYAPPELEDDPTLPIVGYYPALITLTAVMAWVWVVVAWVGIKYFKHAKIQGEDS